MYVSMCFCLNDNDWFFFVFFLNLLIQDGGDFEIAGPSGYVNRRDDFVEIGNRDEVWQTIINIINVVYNISEFEGAREVSGAGRRSGRRKEKWIVKK
jgi:hypothetical protein